MSIGVFQLGFGPVAQTVVVAKVELADAGKPFVGDVNLEPPEVALDAAGNISVNVEQGPIDVLIQDQAIVEVIV